MRFDRADCDGAFVAPPVSHHAHALEGQQDRESLPQPGTETIARDFFHYDRIGAAQKIEPLPGHLADDAHGQTGAGEWFAIDDLGRQPQLASERAGVAATTR